MNNFTVIPHLSSFYIINISRSCLCVCVCQEPAHVPMPLQSQSAPSCCFHSSSESQHSQPRSLPGFPPLVPARSDSLPTFSSFFFFVTLEVQAELESPRCSPTFIHSDHVEQGRDTRKRKKVHIYAHTNSWKSWTQMFLGDDDIYFSAIIAWNEMTIICLVVSGVGVGVRVSARWTQSSLIVAHINGLPFASNICHCPPAA